MAELRGHRRPAGVIPERDTALPKRPQSRDWAQQTSAIVSDAKTQKGLSQKLRDESTATRKATDRQTREQQTHVDDMLKRKVAETQVLKKKIEARLVALQAELDKLTHTRNKAAAMWDGLRKPQKKCENRTHLRDKRPNRERIEDRVFRALETEQDELRKSSDLLGSLVGDADAALSRMAQCKQALKDDHVDKARSLKLDMECLDLPAKAAAEKQREDALEPKFAAPPPIPGAGEGPNAVAKSTTLPMLWKQSTERNVGESAKLEHESNELRRRMQNVMRAVDELQLHNQMQVREALTHKVKTTQSLQIKLNGELLAINSELDELADQRQQVDRALKAKQVPLGIMSKRLAIRRNRPARETVRDMVEEALEQEHECLVGSIKKLETKLKNIDQEMNRLETQATSIESDLRDKTMSFNIDRRCQDLSQCQDSRQSTPSLPSQQSEAGCLRSQAARNERAELFRRGGARLVPKPPRGRTDTLPLPRPRAAPGAAPGAGLGLV